MWLQDPGKMLLSRAFDAERRARRVWRARRSMKKKTMLKKTKMKMRVRAMRQMRLHC